MIDDVLVRVLQAWIIFRKSHDLESLKLKCCERSEELFNALNQFEEAVTTKEEKDEIDSMIQYTVDQLDRLDKEKK